MIVVTLQRNKCIGCNYCVEVSSKYFQMSKKDGKTVLLNSIDNKGFHTLKTIEHDAGYFLEQAQNICPVKIIKVKEP